MSIIEYRSTDAILLDFQKAFDKVPHHRLLYKLKYYRPLSRRLDRCDRVIQNESRDPFGGNVYYVTMQITFLTRKFRNGERNLHCDVVHITTKWVSSLIFDCNGVFAIKAYGISPQALNWVHSFLTNRFIEPDPQ